MISRNPFGWLIRIGALFALGIAAAIATGNPLYLLISLLGFVVLFLGLRNEAIGPTPRWVTSLNEGKELAMKGDWPQALDTFRTTMTRCKDSRSRRIASEQIGLFLLHANKSGDAEPYLREAVSLTSSAFGPMAARTVSLRDQLSDLYIKAGQSWQAAQLHGGAIQRTTASNNPPLGVADAAARYAEAQQLAGNATEAMTYHAKAVEAIEKADPKSPMFTRASISAARSAAAIGDHKRAADILRRALDHTDPYSETHIVEEVRAALVEQYAAMQSYPEAIAVMEQRLKRRVGRDPGRTAEMRRRLAELMDMAGMTEAAAKQRRVAQTLEAMLAAAGHAPSSGTGGAPTEVAPTPGDYPPTPRPDDQPG